MRRPRLRFVYVGVTVLLLVLLPLGTIALLIKHRVQEFELVPFGADPLREHVYLFVGADSGIERLPGDEQYSEGGEARADVLLLARLGEGGSTSLVAIPRDVVIERAGEPERLALALLDGPGAVVEGICTALGVSVDRYVQIDAPGFAGAIDALGGIDMELAAPRRDVAAELDVAAGAQRLDGDTALALVRSRHAEVYEGGAWRSVTSAEGAQDRARFAAAVLAAVRDRLNNAGPLAVAAAVWQASGSLTLGGGLHPGEWQQLARANLDFTMLPVEDIGAPLAVRVGADAKGLLERLGFATNCAGATAG